MNDIDKNSWPSMYLKKIIFNDNSEIELNRNDIILFVGANNVGKSQVLKDIADQFINTNNKKVVIQDIDIEEENIDFKTVSNYLKSHFSYDDKSRCYSIAIPNGEINHFGKDFLKEDYFSSGSAYSFLFTYLNTENRLNITKPIICNSVLDYWSLNIMRQLEKNRYAIDDLNNLLFLIFGIGIDVYEDFINSQFIKMYKIGNQEIIKKTVSTNRRDSLEELKKLENLYDQGDGIRSAVAILASLIVSNHTLYLIDEPETFLHPPQAKMLGRNIVQVSKDKQCFISTHNIDLIRGVLEEDASRVKIIKIDRQEKINTFNIIDNKSIAKLSTDKNLKYTNVLNGLFYKQIVLCENESDCKFYSTILEELDLKTYQNTLFCAVGGKDQFKLIVPLLINLNIKWRVIADIDLINNIDKLKQLLNAIEPRSYDSISNSHKLFLSEFEEKKDQTVKKQKDIKKEIINIFTNDDYMTDEQVKKIRRLLKKTSSLKELKVGGKNILPAGNCINYFEEIIHFLADNNIYILECGEIERLVPNIEAHGNSWVEKVFDQYDDINEKVYDNAKDFLRKVFNFNIQ